MPQSRVRFVRANTALNGSPGAHAPSTLILLIGAGAARHVRQRLLEVDTRLQGRALLATGDEEVVRSTDPVSPIWTIRAQPDRAYLGEMDSLLLRRTGDDEIVAVLNQLRDGTLVINPYSAARAQRGALSGRADRNTGLEVAG